MATLTPNQSDLFPINEMQQGSVPADKLVLEALGDPRWDFRTVAGIARQTGLPEEIVRQVLTSQARLVRKSAVPDRSGAEIYTLRTKPVSKTEKRALLRLFLSKSL